MLYLLFKEKCYSMTSLPATVDEMISASREFVQHSMLAFRKLVTRRRLQRGLQR